MTSETTAPGVVAGLFGRTDTPRLACVALPLLFRSSLATRMAWSIGMAKPSPMLPLCCCSDAPSDAIAVLIPIKAPLALTRAPPELPGLIAASV
ncbi:Uncharacterised protein [Mycobacteroides abscessus subsp. abscessus]|nr:Uncharacterised protein [Mycobacteroides abscessus subsp. abscessus]